MNRTWKEASSDFVSNSYALSWQVRNKFYVRLINSNFLILLKRATWFFLKSYEHFVGSRRPRRVTQGWHASVHELCYFTSHRRRGAKKNASAKWRTRREIRGRDTSVYSTWHTRFLLIVNSREAVPLSRNNEIKWRLLFWKLNCTIARASYKCNITRVPFSLLHSFTSVGYHYCRISVQVSRLSLFERSGFLFVTRKFRRNGSLRCNYV